ncbi:MAG: hypothetical protein Q8P31_13020 [Bacillota bacterium]|nr:hypothetical protein [Bacillota bacterium]
MAEEGDRRRDHRIRLLIYGLLIALIAIGLMFPVAFSSHITPEAQQAFDLVESMGTAPYVTILADYRDPEGDRQLAAVLAHVLRRGGRVVVASFGTETAVRVERAVRTALSQARMTYGQAAIHLGSRSPGGQQYAGACIAGFADAAGGRDHAGEDLNLMPLAHTFRRLDDADLLVMVVDGGGLGPAYGAWVASHHGVHSMIAAAGTAAGEAAGLAEEGRVDAAIPGGRATADYELLGTGRRAAARHMTALTLGTLFILAIIIWAFLSGAFTRQGHRPSGG